MHRKLAGGMLAAHKNKTGNRFNLVNSEGKNK